MLEVKGEADEKIAADEENGRDFMPRHEKFKYCDIEVNGGSLWI